jgi:hypothetical protein
MREATGLKKSAIHQSAADRIGSNSGRDMRADCLAGISVARQFNA